MIEQRSAWRANDVVAYEAVREAANTAIALLLRLTDEGTILPTRAHSDAAEIRRELFHLNGYDRDAVDAARVSLEERIASLSGPS